MSIYGKWQILLVAAAVLFAISTAAPSILAQTPDEPAKQDPAAKDKPAAPAQTPVAPTEPVKPEKPQTPKEKSWSILKDGLTEENFERRAKAVNALGLIIGDANAEKFALAALKDTNARVRMAGVTSLGAMHARHAKEALEEALDDSEPAVVLASANSLLLLKDDAGYDVYYAVLTGNKKANQGLIKEQMKILHDPKKMAQLGLEEGISFVPFGGLGYGVMKTVIKSGDDVATVRGIAARRLARDPDPSTGEALVRATIDKSWIVRAAALETLSVRGDKSVVKGILASLDDEKDDVRYIGAAAIIHLQSLPAKKRTAKSMPAAPAPAAVPAKPQ